jgi:hypothetical protein
MKDFTDELPLAELVLNPGRVLGQEASQSTLHYCSPAHGGWGVVKVALLVPEVYLLFVCPAACGRHGAIAAIEQGYRNRIGYLCISDNEIVLGDYEAEIEQGVRELVGRVKPRPRALIIFVSCIDDLLGTDHTAALARMEAEHNIPIKLARMNPISMAGKLPPGIRVQKSMYEFLEPPAKKDRGIILLGAYRPPTQTSELAKLLNQYGFGPIRHPEYCTDFDSFKEMSQSAAAIIVRPEGRAAGEDLNSRLGIPVLHSFMAYDGDTVMERYHQLIPFLESLDQRPLTGKDRVESAFRAARETAAERGREARALLGDASIAIDSTVTIAPFNLALALVKSGLNVSRIYTGDLPEFEKPSLAELAKLKGDILVSTPIHVRKYGRRKAEALTEIALGFEAGYAAAAPITVPIAFDEQMYGFEGYTLILEKLIDSFQKGASDLRQQVRDYGLVV